MSDRDHGEIVFISNRGYGFIRPDGGERDVYVHARDCDLPVGMALQLRDRVSYEIGTDRNGKTCAKHVLLEGHDEEGELAARKKVPAGLFKAPIDWLTRQQ